MRHILFKFTGVICLRHLVEISENLKYLLAFSFGKKCNNVLFSCQNSSWFWIRMYVSCFCNFVYSAYSFCSTLLPFKCTPWALGWIWIGLDPDYSKFCCTSDCKSLQNLGTGPHLDWVNGKEMQHFFVKRLHFSNHLDFIWTWTLHLKTILDCCWTWAGF